MRNDFDSVITKETDGVCVDYAFVAGNNTCVFIKVGLDGSPYGYENKYLTITDRLNNLYGYSVIVSSNPAGSGKVIEEGYNIALSYMDSLGYSKSHIYYMGFSNGAYRGFVEAANLPFEQFLLIGHINAQLFTHVASHTQGNDFTIEAVQYRRNVQFAVSALNLADIRQKLFKWSFS